MQQQASPPRIKRARSRIACKRCHDRRVRCDAAASGVPCSGCLAVNLGDACRLLNSKRSRGNDGRFSRLNGSQNEGFPSPVSCPTQLGGSPTGPLGALQPLASPDQQRTPPSNRGRVQSVISEPETNNGEADIWSKVVSDDHSVGADGRRVFYVGEPWTLAYVMQWKGRSHSHRDRDQESHRNLVESPTGVHVSVPIDTPPSNAEHINRSMPRASTLQLSDDIQRALVDSYFARNHRLYPVISQTNFRAAFQSGNISPVLLLSVFYAAALHVSDPIVYRAGFDSRQAFLLELYRLAKHHFFAQDDDGSIDQLAYIQAAFLLHNMWQGPNATMDPWTWLGLSIRMAQNIGMHRSTLQSSLSEEDRRLWKRIWWCLHARDRQIASALGKPLMIRDEDCDVEPLSRDDFEDGDSEEMRDFVIEQAKIGILFGSVISSLFTAYPREPSAKEAARIAIMKKLEVWRKELPQSMRCASNPNLEFVSFSALLLEVLFNCLLLLIHRSRQPSPTNGSEDQTASWQPTFDAAQAITRVTETIMNHGSLTDCPLFFTSALFGAMTVHAIRGREAEAHMSLCMIAMRTLSTMYFAAGWIRNLFQKLHERRATSARPTRHPSPARQEPREAPEGADQGNNSMNRMQNDTYLGGFPMECQEECQEESPDNNQGARSFEMVNATAERHLNIAQLEPWSGQMGSLNGFGLMSRNIGGFLDYSFLSDGGFNGVDINLAEVWQDIINTNNFSS